MSLIINGTEIPQAAVIKYNGVSLSDIICDGVKVWAMKRDPVGFGSVGINSYTVPATGLYKLTLYGAAGTPLPIHNTVGGQGGTTVYHAYLTAGTVLYIVCGGWGNTNGFWGESYSDGGYNGGGYGYSSSDGYRVTGGGGCTHIATISGTLASIGYANRSHVLAVAGGGGGCATGNRGCMGGGVTGQNAAYGAGGTQTSGSGFGQGGTSRSGGGPGGGWYGGYGNNAGSIGGSGGSGYIPSSTTVYNGTTYTNYTSQGGNTSTGLAYIQMIA